MSWRPYCYGHWRWVAPWGWTWVGAEPWAFAPFHYGRWVDVQGRWGWIPGTRALHPVYAPALVAFVGGKEFSASLGYLATPGVAAWFPLGPREPFTPMYHGSTAYVNRVNASNLFNPNVQEAKAIYHQRAVNVFAVEDGANRTYANRSSGTVAISQASFVGGQPVAKNLLHIPASTLAQAPVLVHLRVAPQLPTVVAGTPRATPPAGMATAPRTAGVEPSSLHRDQTAAGGGRRPEFFHTEAPPASRASFEARRQGMQRFEPGRPAEAGRPETMHADHPSAAPAVREGGSRPTPAAPHEAEPSHPAPAAAASHK